MTWLLDRIRAWRPRRSRLSLAGPQLIAAFARTYPQATFVEIGANDGDQHDHLRRHLLVHPWTGLLVEPVPYVFERLRDTWRGVNRLTLVNAAVAEHDGTARFYYLRDASREERASLPDWYDGVGSLNRDVILSHARQMPDIADRLVELEVETMTYGTLLTRYGLERVDLLVIDAEGHDWRILRTIDFARSRPRLIVYEHFHLSSADRAAARRRLEDAGYLTMEEGFDTFAVRPGPGDDLDRAWDVARPAVAGVAKEDGC
jgi:FkbM family methyltransferase